MVGQPTTFWRSETFGEQDRSAAIRPSGIVFYRGGVNISVRVAKRPFAPTAPERRSAATEYLMGVYTTRNNYCELTALKFRRPIALLSWKTTQTGHTDSIAPGHRHIGYFA